MPDCPRCRRPLKEKHGILKCPLCNTIYGQDLRELRWEELTK